MNELLWAQTLYEQRQYNVTPQSPKPLKAFFIRLYAYRQRCNLTFRLALEGCSPNIHGGDIHLPSCIFREFLGTMIVLIVDDQKTMRMLSASIVKQMGHEVIEAICGEDAISYCQKNRVDLILLDVEMPGINGFKTAEAIRTDSSSWFPIIFLSAKTSPDFFVEGIKSGGDIYLFKPIVPEVLEAMIRAMERIADMQEELHFAKSEMEKMAHRDSLTGLVNRRGFDSAIELELKKAIKDKSSLALMLVDVDKFKPFNDNLGHPAGDVCLEEVAKLLAGSMHRELDIVTRYGGEEFAIILPNTDALGARQVADRIIRDFGDRKYPHGFSEVAEYVTVSGGIAILESETSVKELLQKADELLYRAKEQGRNQFVW